MALAGVGSASAQVPTTGASALTPKPLPFDPTKVPGLSEKILTSHHDNNYAGAVKRIGAIRAELAKLDMATAPGFMLNGLKREELLAINSMILHEIYFASLGKGGSKPDATLPKRIDADFGGMDKWRAEFTAMGKALGGGSGWVLLTYSPRSGRLINQWANDHTMAIAAATSCWRSTCTNTPITWTTAPRRPAMSTPSWARSTGRTRTRHSPRP